MFSHLNSKDEWWTPMMHLNSKDEWCLQQKAGVSCYLIEKGQGMGGGKNLADGDQAFIRVQAWKCLCLVWLKQRKCTLYLLYVLVSIATVYLFSWSFQRTCFYVIAFLYYFSMTLSTKDVQLGYRSGGPGHRNDSVEVLWHWDCSLLQILFWRSSHSPWAQGL